MRTLWLVVARGGSKGVPRKNLRVIGDRTLIGWKIARAAGAMTAGDMLVCSTEDAEIAAEAERHGAAVLNRPAELATDEAATSDVIVHALRQYRDFSHCMLLEPSAPFTLGSDYAMAMATLSNPAVDAVIGMKEVVASAFCTEMRADGLIAVLAKRILSIQRTRRQDMPVTWTPSGGLYAFRTDMFLKTHNVYGSDSTYGLLQSWPHCLEIDTMTDLAMAECAVERGLV